MDLTQVLKLIALSLIVMLIMVGIRTMANPPLGIWSSWVQGLFAGVVNYNPLSRCQPQRRNMLQELQQARKFVGYKISLENWVILHQHHPSYTLTTNLLY